MRGLQHFDLEEAVRHSLYSPDIEIDMDELRRNLGGGFDVLDTDHPLRRLREWIGKRRAQGFSCSTDDVLDWIEDDMAPLKEVS